MRRWRRLQIDHLSWRLSAFLLAIVLWFLATGQTQRDLAIDQRVVSIETIVENIGDGVTLGEPLRPVELTLEGPRLVLPFQVREVEAYVDLAGLEEGVHRVPVQTRLPVGITAVRIDPGDVMVQLEAVSRRTLPVRVSVIGLSPGLGFVVRKTEPASLEAYGVSSAVERAAFALVVVDAHDPARNVRTMAVTQDGIPIEGIHFAQEIVDVDLELIESPQGSD